MAPGQKVCLF